MKKRILYITAYVPHKAAAGEKNTMIMLRDLAEEYDVDLIYYKYNQEAEYMPEKDNIRPIMVIQNSLFLKLLGVLSFPIVYPYFSIRFNWLLLFKIRKIVKRNEYQAIILNHSPIFLFGKFLNKATPKILFAHDVIAQRVIRSSSTIMQKFCIMSERFSLRMENSHIFSFSQKDCDLIRSLYHKPAGLCLDYIDEQIVNKVPEFVGDYFTLLGDWKRKENLEGAIWLLDHVIPLLNRKITIKVVGRDFPTDYAKRSDVDLQALGFVDDPYQIISNSKALLTPLFQGAGIKVKVIEALACGTPVIGTDIAFEGLPQGFDKFMLLCNSEQQFANAIQSVNIPINERVLLKNKFISCYQQDSIRNYIKKL